MTTHTKNIIFPPDAIVTLEMILRNGLEKKCINHKVKKNNFSNKRIIEKSTKGAAKNAKEQKMLAIRKKLKLVVTENSDTCHLTGKLRGAGHGKESLRV